MKPFWIRRDHLVDFNETVFLVCRPGLVLRLAPGGVALWEPWDGQGPVQPTLRCAGPPDPEVNVQVRHALVFLQRMAEETP